MSAGRVVVSVLIGVQLGSGVFIVAYAVTGRFMDRRLRRRVESDVVVEARMVTQVAAQSRLDCRPMTPDRLAELVSDACEAQKEMGLTDE